MGVPLASPERDSGGRVFRTWAVTGRVFLLVAIRRRHLVRVSGRPGVTAHAPCERFVRREVGVGLSPR